MSDEDTPAPDASDENDGSASAQARQSVRLIEIGIGAYIEIGSWPNRLETVATRLGEILGAEMPRRPGHFAEGNAALVGWLAFGRFVWLSDNTDDTLRLMAALGSDDAAIVDLGPARQGFRVSGDASSTILNKAVAIDFDAHAFPSGSLAQTMIHRVPVAILRREDTVFDLYAPSSLAHALNRWLRDACMECGVADGEPTDVMNVRA